MVYLLGFLTLLNIIMYLKLSFIYRQFKIAENLIYKNIEENRKSPLYTLHSGGGYEH